MSATATPHHASTASPGYTFTPWQGSQACTTRMHGIHQILSPDYRIGGGGLVVEVHGSVFLVELGETSEPLPPGVEGNFEGYVGTIVQVHGTTPPWLLPLLGDPQIFTSVAFESSDPTQRVRHYFVSNRTARLVRRAGPHLPGLLVHQFLNDRTQDRIPFYNH